MPTKKQLTCPIPQSDYPKITLAHGGGGLLSNELVDKIFAPVFNDPLLYERHDGARTNVKTGEIAFSTDSHVVKPLFFPGGDIGKLAVCGTVNDIAMCGAKPEFLSVGFILEEGLPMETLWQVVLSMKEAAKSAGVRIVTGDTKVVEHGKGDGIYINTSGIGQIISPTPISPASIQTGDAIILSGDIGRHGVAVMAAREGLQFESHIQSDCAPLNRMIEALFDENIEVRCLRDLTRGGLATALVEIASSSKQSIEVLETTIPVKPEVESACELLGLDPLFVANEGRCIAIVPEKAYDLTINTMKRFACGRGACRIGVIEKTSGSPQATLRTAIGTHRLLSLFSGEQLPRIC
ncbi:hydrogenase expression/formation protein HypE [Verrucomicrobiia bacterium DG1235]|nr:hydrogenase expression/formation protein HypE [Verrucomicrobiae bacterium DG1235]